MGFLDRLADALEDVVDRLDDAIEDQSNGRSGKIRIPQITISSLPLGSSCNQGRSPGFHRPSPPPQRHTTPAAYPTPQSLMPRSSGCLSAREFIDRRSLRRRADIEEAKLAHYRSWLHNDVIPVLNQNGEDVSESSMEMLIDFFGESLFWNSLKRTRFRWSPGLHEDYMLGQTTVDGLVIYVDPDPRYRGSESKADRILSTLVHECCHALLHQHCCRGGCGRRGCEDLWIEQVEGDRWHGPEWCRLAGLAEGVANRRGLFRCRTGWSEYRYARS